MSKVLTIDEMLEAAQACNPPRLDSITAAIEGVATILGCALADHLKIDLAREAEAMGIAFGGTCCSFVPRTAGQECPKEILEFDPDCDWDDPLDDPDPPTEEKL